MPVRRGGQTLSVKNFQGLSRTLAMPARYSLQVRNRLR